MLRLKAAVFSLMTSSIHDRVICTTRAQAPEIQGRKDKYFASFAVSRAQLCCMRKGKRTACHTHLLEPFCAPYPTWAGTGVLRTGLRTSGDEFDNALGEKPMGVYLTGLYLAGMHPMSVLLIGVYLIGVAYKPHFGGVNRLGRDSARQGPTGKVQLDRDQLFARDRYSTDRVFLCL
jgi:hypothetical protein